MRSYPSKLMKYLDGLSSAERQAKERLFDQTLAQAEQHGFQSPRFWASRQILGGLSERRIQHKIRRRLVEKQS